MWLFICGNYTLRLDMLVLITTIVLLGYIKGESRIVFFLEVGMYIILLGGYNGSIDLIFYQYRYDRGIISEGILEGLYDRIAWLFHECNIDFRVFHVILTIISISLIAYVINKVTSKPAFVMSALFGFCTIEYSLQLKSMCAAAIIIYAMYHYYRGNKSIKRTKKILFLNRISYVLLILLASGFHFLSLFFLIFLFIDYINVKKLKYWIIVQIMISIFLFQHIENILLTMVNTMADYVGNYRSPIVYIGMSVWQIVGVVLVMVTNSYWKKKDEKRAELSEFVYKGSLIVLLIVPFYSLTTVVNRVIKIWCIFYYVIISEIPSSASRFNLIKFFMEIYGILSTIVFYFIISDGTGYNVFLDILANNIFFQ